MQKLNRRNKILEIIIYRSLSSTSLCRRLLAGASNNNGLDRLRERREYLIWDIIYGSRCISVKCTCFMCVRTQAEDRYVPLESPAVAGIRGRREIRDSYLLPHPRRF